MLWDIFCRVIDNYGDIGICWRLAADLTARGHTARLWTDDSRALQWMAPGALQGDWPGVRVLDWKYAQDPAFLATLPLADVWLEGFGCDMPIEMLQHGVLQHQQAGIAAPTWINLEYLSAEAYVERSHRLPSPVMSGPATGWTKHFFYPGFTARTGGLLRETDLTARTDSFTPAQQSAFLQRCGIPWQGERLISLFCYAPTLLPELLDQLAAQPIPTLLLATHGKAWAALQGHPAQQGNLRIAALPALSQTAFDDLLRSCALNFVRGEDSVVRAIWAGKPFIWQIYPQDENAHAAKLHAFLKQLALGPAAQALHLAWNGLSATQDATAAVQWLCSNPWNDWEDKVHAARSALRDMHDLTDSLVQFVRNKR